MHLYVIIIIAVCVYIWYSYLSLYIPYPTSSVCSLRVLGVRKNHKGNIMFAAALKNCARVCQGVIFIGTDDEHIVDDDLTYVAYEAVLDMNAHTFLKKVCGW